MYRHESVEDNMDYGIEERWQEIRKLWKQNQWLYVLIGIFIGLLISPFIGTDKQEFLEGLVPEALGIGFTVLILDRLATRHSKAQMKDYLIYKMRSSLHDEVVRSVEEIRWRGWLNDGTLHKAKLNDANLQDVDLSNIDLQEANLVFANLQGANLTRANFRAADLRGANLQNAHLGGTDFRGANLQHAELAEARLYRIDFHLRLPLDTENAVFERFERYPALFDENTILPNGKRWNSKMKMNFFTQPEYSSEE
jgi:hypothetical protein